MNTNKNSKLRSKYFTFVKMPHQF